MKIDISQKALFQLFRVWFVIFLTLCCALFITYKIMNGSNLELIDIHGAINTKLVMATFKLPVTIIAAGLSLLLLLATQHRSVQTAEQIKLTNEANENSIAQNTLRNYYDSITDFDKYLTDNFSSDLLYIRNKRRLYTHFFPENTHKKVIPYVTKETHLAQVNQYITLCNDNVKYHMKDNNDPVETLECVINTFLAMIKNRYGLNIKNNVFNEGDLVMNNFQAITIETRNMLTFCMDYTPSNGLVMISNSVFMAEQPWKDLVSLVNNSELDRYIFDIKIQSIDNGYIKLQR